MSSSGGGRSTWSRSATRGFSLIETMIAVAIVGFIGSGTALLLSYNARATAQTRARVTVAAEADAVLQRMVTLADLARIHGGTPTFCAAVTAAGGPMAGGTASGTCPSFSSTGIPIQGSPLTRNVTVASVSIGAQAGYEITVAVTSPHLSAPVEVRSLIPRFGDE